MEDRADVWVHHRERNAPAHRIPRQHAPRPGETHAAYTIACPPYVVVGGAALTRTEAQDLRLHPCVRCFEVTQRLYPPLPPPPPAPDVDLPEDAP